MFDKRSEGNYNKLENNSPKKDTISPLWNLLRNALSGTGANANRSKDEKHKSVSEEINLTLKRNNKTTASPIFFLDYETETSTYDWSFIKISHAQTDALILDIEFTGKADNSTYTPYLANKYFAWALPPTYINDIRYDHAQNHPNGQEPQINANTHAQDSISKFILIIIIILFYALLFFMLGMFSIKD